MNYTHSQKTLKIYYLTTAEQCMIKIIYLNSLKILIFSGTINSTDGILYAYRKSQSMSGSSVKSLSDPQKISTCMTYIKIYIFVYESLLFVAYCATLQKKKNNFNLISTRHMLHSQELENKWRFLRCC